MNLISNLCIKSILVAFITLISISLTAQTKEIDLKKSKINWVGKKVTGQHTGTVDIKDGRVAFKKERLTGGAFTIDMTTITDTDLSGDYQTKLNNHLKSEAFFETNKFPTANLIFKSIKQTAKNTYTITADLTIKGITNPITFDLISTKNSAKTNFNISRSKYDIKYKVEKFGDKAISDEFELDIVLFY